MFFAGTKLTMYKPPRRHNPARSFSMILNLAMGVIYLACGIFLLFVPVAARLLPSSYLLPVGIALLLYGLFRGFRAWWAFKHPSSL